MPEIYYGTLLCISVVLAFIYAYMWHKHFETHITLLFIILPLSDLGHFLGAQAQDTDTAVMAMKITYIGGIFSPLMIMLMVFSLCEIKLSRLLKIAAFVLCGGVYSSVLTIGSSDIFYSYMHFDEQKHHLYREYGFMHTVFQVTVIIMFAISLAAIVYSYLKKNQVSRKMLMLLFFPEIIGFVSYFFGRNFFSVELTPVSYDLAMIVYLVIVYKMCLYDVSDSAIDSLVETGDTGFISFDFGYNYLGSNETAKSIFPQLAELTVDKSIDRNDFFKSHARVWLDEFKDNNSKNEVLFNRKDKTFLINIKYLFDGRRNRGYQFFITDDTKNQQYIRLINNFNSQLRSEVEQKTDHIQKMHDNLILSMATMVESRDNSTGGHIRRTSEVVRILIDEIKKSGKLPLDDKFCKDIIKAAPMHDLGKIAVDDSILRKPGRFTDEEYDKMKVHAAEGARIVHEILKDTDDEQFKVLAENVAHFHHERVDGSGYPEGLKGDEIPIEARIMAIADVYDALVSKRVYKERMSFEQADKIITEGMGKHFDKALEPYYAAARPRLEEYYRENDS